ncbi:MAG: acyltransferase domain-containing protein, partial [Ruminococcus sp.]|nr:acyltransferase domain-containing protein [Ruminococcus sp.]
MKDNMKRPLDIAIVGIALKMPGCDDLNGLWNELSAGRDSITRRNFYRSRDSVRSAYGSVEDLFGFDNGFFGISEAEAMHICPADRWMLQTAYHALEDACIVPGKTDDRIGIVCGSGFNEYQVRYMVHSRSEKSVSDAMFSGAGTATRTAYKLDLTGPCVYALSACSTSLTTVQLACKYLRDGEADVMLAGGATMNPQQEYYSYMSGVMSEDTYTRAFDEKASGFVPGNGCAAVVLKRLEDAERDGDHIYSVIKAVSIGNDGSRKASFTAPSLPGEYEVIKSALEASGVDINDIDYIETHGTATAIGDAIEAEALRKAFADANASKKIPIGSIKNNMGHLDAAAGVAGLIKSSLILDRGEIPAAVNFDRPGKALAGQDRFYVNTKAEKLDKTGRLLHAGISSFGVGGENAHCVIEEYRRSETSAPESRTGLFVLSASSQEALERNTSGIVSWLKENSSRSVQAAYAFMNCRREMPFRRTFIAEDGEVKVMTDISRFDEDKEYRTVFMFPGSGTAAVNFTADIRRRSSIFRKYHSRCVDIVLGLTGGKADISVPGTDNMDLRIVSVDYSAAMMLEEIGIVPDALAGHSLGEYAMAAFGGIMPIEDVLELVYRRSVLISGLPQGRMISVAADRKRIEPFITQGVYITGCNVRDRLTVTCTEDAFEGFTKKLTGERIIFKVLDIGSCGHTDIMKGIEKEYLACFDKVRFHESRYPVYSTLDGSRAESGKMQSPGYWTQLMEKPVMFEDACHAIRNDLDVDEDLVLIETGSNDSLSGFAGRIFMHDEKVRAFPAMKLYEDGDGECHEWYGILRLIGELWKTGISFSRESLFPEGEQPKISLPQYSFDMKRFNILDQFESGLSAVDISEDDIAVLRDIEAEADRRRGIRLLREIPSGVEVFHKLSAAAAMSWFASAGLEKGIGYPLDEIVKKGSVIEKYVPFVKFLGNVLTEKVLASKEGEILTLKDDPSGYDFEKTYEECCGQLSDFRAYFGLVKECVDAYGDVFSGNRIGNEIIYPDGSFDHLSDIDKDTPEYKNTMTYVETLAGFIAGKVKKCGRKVRILEIGGGTAELTQPLLEQIRDCNIEYWFTDIGTSFVIQAENSFDEDIRKKMQFRTFNIENAPSESGIPEEYFDIVVGLDVVQATSDIRKSLGNLRRILRPCGMTAMAQ